jgi:leucyl aminopeptidase (aminopeptidase T)
MITEGMMYRGVMLADYRKVSRLTQKVSDLLTKSSEAEIATPAGTDLHLNIAGREAHSDTGIFHKPGDFGNLPAGEAFIAPIEGDAEGRAVIDGRLGGMRGVIKIVVRKGWAKKISGKPSRKIRKMLDEAGPKAYNLAEFGIGTNPKARLFGNPLEDEKVLGTCHVALGDNSTFGGKVRAGIHIDGVLLRPTIKLDDKTLMRDGQLKV